MFISVEFRLVLFRMMLVDLLLSLRKICFMVVVFFFMMCWFIEVELVKEIMLIVGDMVSVLSIR